MDGDHDTSTFVGPIKDGVFDGKGILTYQSGEEVSGLF